MLVVVGNCCGGAGVSVEQVGGESAVQIVQNLSFEAVHEELVAMDVGEGDVGDVDFLCAVGEEVGPVAVRAGLQTVGLCGVVVEPNIVDPDVAEPGSDDALRSVDTLGQVSVGLADNHRIFEYCKVPAEIGDPELGSRTFVLSSGEIIEHQIGGFFG